MGSKTFAILTDIHSNLASLREALKIIQKKNGVDQIISLGDCFSLGPDPKNTLKTLKEIPNCIFIRGNHDRYIYEKLWEEERPTLEGMDPDDPLVKDIVANEKWTAEKLGPEGVAFCKNMQIAHREIIGSTLVEFTHAWYQRDDQPPSIIEALNWRNHVSAAYPELTKFVFIHGHIHIPRKEEKENLTLLCQGAVGLPFDEDPRGSVAFLTVAEKSFQWEVVRYEYNKAETIQLLEKRQPPFYLNLKNTVQYAAIRNDL